MEKAIFLDRDGTINVDCEYLHDISKFKLIPGTIEALKMLQDAGYLLIVITNQSGIGRGFFTEEEYLILEQWIDEMLYKKDIKITAYYHCPHVDTDNCQCRKPKMGMFYQAAVRFDIDWSKSFAIGDKLRDLCICENTPTKGILIENERTYEDGTDPLSVIYPKVSSLLEASKLILEGEKIS